MCVCVKLCIDYSIIKISDMFTCTATCLYVAMETIPS